MCDKNLLATLLALSDDKRSAAIACHESWAQLHFIRCNALFALWIHHSNSSYVSGQLVSNRPTEASNSPDDQTRVSVISLSPVGVPLTAAAPSSDKPYYHSEQRRPYM